MEAFQPPDNDADQKTLPNTPPDVPRLAERETAIKTFRELRLELRDRIRAELYANATRDPQLSLIESQYLLTPAEQVDFQEHLLGQLDSSSKIALTGGLIMLDAPKVVTRLLTDPDPAVRSAMARHCWNAKALRTHARLLATDSEPEVRAAVASNFFFVFNHPELAKPMLSDQSPLVRTEIARNEVTALRFPKLIKALFSDTHADVRAGLAKNKWATTLYPDLTQKLFEDPEPQVRAALADNEAATSLFPRLAADLFTDKSADVRLAILDSDLAEKSPDLVNDLRDDPDKRVRESALSINI